MNRPTEQRSPSPIRVEIGEPFAALLERADEAERHWLAGEVTEDCETILSFVSWAALAHEMARHDPGVAAQLLGLPEAERGAFLETPAAVTILVSISDDIERGASTPLD